MLGTNYVGKKRVMTEKQTIAWRRNWAIRQLRAFYHLIPPAISVGNRAQIQKIIDREILSLGAESEVLRQRKRAQDQEELERLEEEQQSWGTYDVGR
jgi:hypothetical protein